MGKNALIYTTETRPNFRLHDILIPYHNHRGRHLQRTDLKRSWPRSNGVVSDRSVASRQHHIRLPRNRRRTVWCSGNGESEASIDGGRATSFNQQMLVDDESTVEILTERRPGP